MIRRFEDLEPLLAGTILAGREHCTIPVEPTGQDVFAIEIEGDQVLDAWRAARRLVDRTGRWPVAINCFVTEQGLSLKEAIDGSYLFLPDARFEHPILPADVIARSRGRDLERTLDRLIEGFWPEDDMPDDESIGPGDVDDWFEPADDDRTAIVFLPTPHGWESLAWLDFYGTEIGDDAHVALLHRWHQEYGAELVAHFDTMLQFVVKAPPSDEDAALALARQQVMIAPCTTLLPGIALRAHARRLIGSERWFLHERP